MTLGVRIAFGAVAVIANFLAFPHPVGDGVLDLGLVFVWIFPAALLLTLRALPPRAAFRWGFVVGTLAYAAVFHWIYVVTVRYGHAPVAVGIAAPLLLAMWPGLFVALFAGARAWLLPRGVGGPFVAAALFTALEAVRGELFTGFPWAALGYAQHGNDALIGLASWTGVHGLTFTSVLLPASALYWLWPPRGELEGRAAVRGALGLAVAALLHILGMLGAPLPVEGPTTRIAVLQGNIDQGVKWSPEWAERTLGIYEQLSRDAAREGAEWILWPETAVPGSPDGDAALEARLGRLARETGATLVVGAVGVRFTGRPDAPGRAEPELYDSAFGYAPDGRRLDRYDKTHLVPFGEYLPLRPLFGFFVRAIATGSAGRDVTPGAAPRVVALPDPVRGRTGAGAGPRATPSAASAEPLVPVGVPICYELLFPDLVRRFAADGARVLLGITNDAWYGRTGAPFQFLAITAMRSAETGLWTARAANTGVSAFIDGRGRVRSRTAIFERGFLVEDVPLAREERGATFYTRTGDWLPWLCGVTCLLAGLLGRRQQGGAS